MCKAMMMGTHSVTHREKNECYIPYHFHFEWGPMYKIAWLELIHLKSYKAQANKSTKFHIVLFITWCPFSQILCLDGRKKVLLTYKNETNSQNLKEL